MFNDQVINTTTSYKYLGVKLDPHVYLIDHLNSVYNKASSRLLRLLKRLRINLTDKSALAIYNSMILPIFTYCSIVSPFYNATYNGKLTSFHERASQIIHYNNPSNNKLKTIQYLHHRSICIFVYMCLNNLLCPKLNEYYNVISSNTRNKNNIIRLPKCRIECYRKSLIFYGAKIYNELPLDVRKYNFFA